MFDNMDLVLAYMRAHPKYSDLDIRYAVLSEYFEGKRLSHGAGGVALDGKDNVCRRLLPLGAHPQRCTPPTSPGQCGRPRTFSLMPPATMPSGRGSTPPGPR